MRILVLSKRMYMGKDLLDDRFGRFRELPLELATLGHDVMGICLSYQQRQKGLFTDVSKDGTAQVHWHSMNIGRLVIPGLIHYLREVKRLSLQYRPDLIWCCSDSFHAIFGVWLANRLNTKKVVDLYDNFENYGATRFSGVLPLFRRAVRAADGVTCVSKPLAERLFHSYRRTGPTVVLENAVRRDLFYPQDRTACRRLLGLPEDAKIIGTAGALYRSRGIRALFRGFELLAAKENNLHLAIAGPRDRCSQIPNGPRVHDLGVLPLDEVPLLINALDVAVVCNRDSLFGRYCFPQKTYEVMACRTPLVAAAVGSMKDMLDEYPECLFEPEAPQSCADAIRSQLIQPTVVDFDIPSWGDMAKRLETFLIKATTSKTLA